MTSVLLVSEDFIKTNSAIDDNLFGKFLLPAIREAQDVGLQSIIGSCLYKKLISLISEGLILDEEYAAYKALLDDYIQPYMLYQVHVGIVPIISVKLANIGTVLTNDEYVSNLNNKERDLVLHHYQNLADSYCKQLQNYLKTNKDLYPELECGCECDGNIKPNLNSSASSDIWLGGFRSR